MVLINSGKFLEILAVPARKGLQQLQPLAGRRNFDSQALAAGRRRNKPFLTLRETLGRKLFTHRRQELEFLPIRALEGLIHRIESKIARDRVGRHDFRTRKE